MEVKRCGEKEFLSADKLRIRENEIHIWCICWPEMTDFWKNHEYILSEQESALYCRETYRANSLEKILRCGNS